MIVSRWILTGALVVTGACAWAADEAASPAAQAAANPGAQAAAPIAGQPGPAAAAPPQLPADAIAQAVKLDEFTVPTPGELLAALNKVGKPTWQAQYRPPIPTAYTDRPQIALNLGGLIADGYIAVEAEDSQQVKNIGKDIMTLAKTLGVSENVLRRGKSIEDFAENNEWSTLKEDLEATQNEVKLAMDEQHDEELTTLVTLGGWIRGTEAVSGWIVNNYSEPAAKLLRQPAIISLLRGKLDALPQRTRDDELLKSLDGRLKEMQDMVSFPNGQTPTQADVKKLHDAASEMIATITAKR